MSRYVDTRFWRWWRKVPIVVMAILLAVALAYQMAPGALLRQFLFPVQYADYIEESSERYGLDPYLVCAVIKCESNWDAEAESSAGAQGLMQLMPETAEYVATWSHVDSATYRADNLTDPATNIEYGCAYLAYLLEELGSQDAAIAAYNAGLGSVQSWISEGESVEDLDIQYPETASYVESVNFAYQRYQELYPDGIQAEE